MAGFPQGAVQTGLQVTVLDSGGKVVKQLSAGVDGGQVVVFYLKSVHSSTGTF